MAKNIRAVATVLIPVLIVGILGGFVRTSSGIICWVWGFIALLLPVYGGWIEAKAVVGQGAIFYFTLPTESATL